MIDLLIVRILKVVVFNSLPVMLLLYLSFTCLFDYLFVSVLWFYSDLNSWNFCCFYFPCNT